MNAIPKPKREVATLALDRLIRTIPGRKVSVEVTGNVCRYAGITMI